MNAPRIRGAPHWRMPGHEFVVGERAAVLIDEAPGNLAGLLQRYDKRLGRLVFDNRMRGQVALTVDNVDVARRIRNSIHAAWSVASR